MWPFFTIPKANRKFVDKTKDIAKGYFGLGATTAQTQINGIIREFLENIIGNNFDEKTSKEIQSMVKKIIRLKVEFPKEYEEEFKKI